MTKGDLDELHYITPIANVGSIVTRGILSHQRAGRVSHESVAMDEIQERRRRVMVPGGRPLHEYANLYVCGRNPMLFVRRAQHERLRVLRVDVAVLDLPGVVVAARNASSDHARFGPAPAAPALLDQERIFAEYWTHPDDQIEEWRHKSIKCAEVLVPDRVAATYVIGAYVSCSESRDAVRASALGLNVTVKAQFFFR